MSDLKFACPHCNQNLEVPEELLGQTVECPTCAGKLALPKPVRAVQRTVTPPLPSQQAGPTTAGHEPDPRPKTVTTAVTLLYMTLGIGVIRGILEASRLSETAPIGFVVFIMLATLGITGLFIYAIAKGRNWARITFLVLAIIGTPLAVKPLLESLAASPFSGVLGILQSLLQIVGLVLLFLKPSSHWFKKMKGKAGPSATRSATTPGDVSQASPAGVWRSVLALFVDGVVLMPITYGFMFGAMAGFAGTTGGRIDPMSSDLFQGVIGGCILLFWWLYSAILEASRAQGTLGKMLLGIKVTDLQGHKISFGKASGRFFAKFLSVAIMYIGFLMAGWTSRKQALHDMVSGCLVMKK